MSTPYWPTCFMVRCENGWIVRRGFTLEYPAGDALPRLTSGPAEVTQFVFNSWVECAEFLQLVTTPAAGVPVLTEGVKP